MEVGGSDWWMAEGEGGKWIERFESFLERQFLCESRWRICLWMRKWLSPDGQMHSNYSLEVDGLRCAGFSCVSRHFSVIWRFGLFGFAGHKLVHLTQMFSLREPEKPPSSLNSGCAMPSVSPKKKHPKYLHFNLNDQQKMLLCRKLFEEENERSKKKGKTSAKKMFNKKFFRVLNLKFK